MDPSRLFLIHEGRLPVSANLPPQAKNERADKADAVQLPGIARVLIQHQLLSPEQAREAHAKAQAAENGNFLDELVINSKVLNPLRLATFLAETFGIEVRFVDDPNPV